MIYGEDPFRRRPRKSTESKKRKEKCDWMAENPRKWPSKRGPIAKIVPSGGCKGDTVLVAVERWYDFPEFGGSYLSRTDRRLIETAYFLINSLR